MAESNEPTNDNLDTYRREIRNIDELDPIALIDQVYQLSWRWAHFELHIISPILGAFKHPVLVEPEVFNANEKEFVYTIQDYGNRFLTSKAEDMYRAGMSMCKLFYTIEKIIYLLIERLKEQGGDAETEVQVALLGHELALRKGFESIINLNYNVVVTNFDPGLWGENYLRNVKVLAEKGYGYPESAPRDLYRRHRQSSTPGMGR